MNEYVAQRVFKFRDVRETALCSLSYDARQRFTFVPKKKLYHFLQIIIFVALNTARFQNNTNTFL
jgi:hypothetical protein